MPAQKAVLYERQRNVEEDTHIREDRKRGDGDIFLERVNSRLNG